MITRGFVNGRIVCRGFGLSVIRELGEAVCVFAQERTRAAFMRARQVLRFER